MGISLSDFDAVQTDVPVVAKFKPSSNFNISDYHRAGGVPATLAEIRRFLHLDETLAMGGTLGDFLREYDIGRTDRNIIREGTDPFFNDGCRPASCGKQESADNYFLFWLYYNSLAL